MDNSISSDSVNRSRPLGTYEHLWLRLGQIDSNNFVMVAQLTGNLDEERLTRALNDVMRAETHMRSRVIFKNGKPHLTVEEPPVIPLTKVARKDDDHWKEYVEAELKLPLPVEGFPLWRFAWLKGDGCHELLLTFNHMISDGRSGVVFYEKLFKRMDDSEAEIHCNSLSPSFEYQLRSTDGVLKSPGKFFSALADHVRKSRKRWYKLPSIQTSQTGTGFLSRTLPEEDLLRIVSQCRQRGVTVSSFFSALMAMELPTEKTANVSLSVTVDMRAFVRGEHFDEIGYFVTAVDMIKDSAFDGTVWELADTFRMTIKQKLCKSWFKFGEWIRNLALHQQKDPTALKQLIRASFNHSMMFTNLGRLPLAVSYKDFQLDRCFGIPAVHLMDVPFLCLAIVTFNDQMMLNFCYPKSQFERRQVEDWADQIMENLP